MVEFPTIQCYLGSSSLLVAGKYVGSLRHLVISYMWLLMWKGGAYLEPQMEEEET